MTSRGRKALSVTCGDSSPKGRAKGIVYWHKKWSVSVSIRSIPFTATPLNACRRKSDGRKTVSVPAPLASPCGRGVASSSEDGEGQIAATSIGKCWHLRRQMTSAGARPLSVTCGDSSPKGRAKASYIGTRNGAYLYRYAPFCLLRLPPLNARAARKSDGRKTVSVPAPPLPLWGRWPAARTEESK